ncbi:HAMP domain-containing protein [Babesia caballi]|uniref:HAMP domain-containing protein n=1 Tax=Babesia caballi TaxID=5871 RepID=A0AAV4LV23_BABCB|nr:HAMP domain-containing protein [Babesia caballi]
MNDPSKIGETPPSISDKIPPSELPISCRIERGVALRQRHAAQLHAESPSLPGEESHGRPFRHRGVLRRQRVGHAEAHRVNHHVGAGELLVVGVEENHETGTAVEGIRRDVDGGSGESHPEERRMTQHVLQPQVSGWHDSLPILGFQEDRELLPAALDDVDLARERAPTLHMQLVDRPHLHHVASFALCPEHQVPVSALRSQQILVAGGHVLDDARQTLRRAEDARGHHSVDDKFRRNEVQRFRNPQVAAGRLQRHAYRASRGGKQGHAAAPGAGDAGEPLAALQERAVTHNSPAEDAIRPVGRLRRAHQKHGRKNTSARVLHPGIQHQTLAAHNPRWPVHHNRIGERHRNRCHRLGGGARDAGNVRRQRARARLQRLDDANVTRPQHLKYRLVRRLDHCTLRGQRARQGAVEHGQMELAAVRQHEDRRQHWLGLLVRRDFQRFRHQGPISHLGRPREVANLCADGVLALGEALQQHGAALRLVPRVLRVLHLHQRVAADGKLQPPQRRVRHGHAVGVERNGVQTVQPLHREQIKPPLQAGKRVEILKGARVSVGKVAHDYQQLRDRRLADDQRFRHLAQLAAVHNVQRTRTGVAAYEVHVLHRDGHGPRLAVKGEVLLQRPSVKQVGDALHDGHRLGKLRRGTEGQRGAVLQLDGLRVCRELHVVAGTQHNGELVAHPGVEENADALFRRGRERRVYADQNLVRRSRQQTQSSRNYMLATTVGVLLPHLAQRNLGGHGLGLHDRDKLGRIVAGVECVGPLKVGGQIALRYVSRVIHEHRVVDLLEGQSRRLRGARHRRAPPADTVVVAGNEGSAECVENHSAERLHRFSVRLDLPQGLGFVFVAQARPAAEDARGDLVAVLPLNRRSGTVRQVFLRGLVVHGNQRVDLQIGRQTTGYGVLVPELAVDAHANLLAGRLRHAVDVVHGAARSVTIIRGLNLVDE